MKKRIFFCSDIHGNFDALIEGLEKAGYKEDDENNLLVVLGDLFDRGTDSLRVYQYLKRLSDENKAIITMGNHEGFLIRYLDGTSISPFNYLRNGTDETLADFLGRTKPFESWCFIDKELEYPTDESFAEWISIAKDDINKEYPELLSWLKLLPRYFESKNYIGVHGAIDTKVEDWHNPHCVLSGYVDWDALDFDDGTFFGKNINNTDKTVVIGHFGTRHLREIYGISDGKEDNDILIREDGRIVALDATTILTNKINVFVVEDELLE